MMDTTGAGVSTMGSSLGKKGERGGRRDDGEQRGRFGRIVVGGAGVLERGP